MNSERRQHADSRSRRRADARHVHRHVRELPGRDRAPTARRLAPATVDVQEDSLPNAVLRPVAITVIGGVRREQREQPANVTQRPHPVQPGPRRERGHLHEHGEAGRVGEANRRSRRGPRASGALARFSGRSRYQSTGWATICRSRKARTRPVTPPPAVSCAGAVDARRGGRDRSSPVFQRDLHPG